MLKKIYICDLCGKEDTNFDNQATVSVEQYGDRQCKIEYDVCKSCWDNISTFIKGMKKSNK